MSLTTDEQIDRALLLAGYLAQVVRDVTPAAWEAAAERPGLLPHYRDIVLAALAFRRAVDQSLASPAPGRPTAPEPIARPLPQPETPP